MKNSRGKQILSFSFLFLYLFSWAQAQDIKTIKLGEPNKKGGLSVMEALAVRASASDWSDRELSPSELSDLLWAANGINRPDSKKRTAASAMNAQDVDIYVFLKEGVYLYDAANRALNPVLAGDHRKEFATTRPRPAAGTGPAGTISGGAGSSSAPPVHLVLISDNSRFGGGTPESKREWGAIDTGIVSQNIALFCAAKGLATRPRASVDKDKMRTLLKLKDTQFPLLEHPVSYLPTGK